MARNFGGIARGMQAGLQMAQSIQDRNDRKEQSDREFGLRQTEQETRLARQAAADERADADYGAKVAGDLRQSAVGTMTRIASQYGSFEAAPPEVQDRARVAADEAETAVNTARDKRTKIAFGTERRELGEVISNLQTGRVQLDEIPPAQLFKAVASVTGRDPADFMSGPDGSPSPISKAVGDITTGLETKNDDMVVKGANVLLAPELRRGVGGPSAHGGKIVYKEIDRLVPHPDNPQLVTPVLRVYVDQGGDFKGPRGKHQETSYYLAPLTQGRSSDPNDPVKFIDMGAAMDRVGRMGTLTQLMAQPQVRERMEAGRTEASAAAKALLDDYYAEGVAGLPKKTTTAENVRLGDKTLRITKDAQGKEVGREELPHATTAKTPALQARLDTIDRLEEEGEFNAAEAEEARKAALSIRPRPPRGTGGGGGGKGGAAGGKATEAAVKGAVGDATKAVVADLGLKYSAITKGYQQADGKPATPEQLTELQRRVTAAAVVARDSAATGKLAPLSDMLAATKTESATPSAKPKTVSWKDLK
jgi:hypothetical protein